MGNSGTATAEIEKCKKKYNYKVKTGKPSTYRQEFCEQMIEAAKNGDSPTSWGQKELGIVQSTVYDWAKKYPEFAEAKKKADEAFSQWYADFVKRAMAGEVPNCNPTLTIWFGKNLSGNHSWRDNKKMDEAKISLIEAQKKLIEYKMSGGIDNEDVNNALNLIADAIGKTSKK